MNLALAALLIIVASLARLGVLCKEGRGLSLQEWTGHILTSALWGYAVSVGVLEFGPALSPWALVAVSGAVGYLGDRQAFHLVRSFLSARGIEVDNAQVKKQGA